MRPLSTEMADRYRIAATPNIRAQRNRRTWDQLVDALGLKSATESQLVAMCGGHNHPEGGKGFVRYCLKNNWLVRSNNDIRADDVVSHRGVASTSVSTGFYIAYPTTDELKPVYRGRKAKVNRSHTKVGITKDSFEVRGKEYARTFDGEVEFRPIRINGVESGLLAELETRVLNEVSKRYSRVGTTREWFDTTERDEIVAIVLKIVAESGTQNEIGTNSGAWHANC